MDRKQREIEATLESFDGMQRARVSPFFHARVMAAFEHRHTPSKNYARSDFRPAFAITMLVVFLVLNIITISALTKNKTIAANYPEASIAEQYDLGVTTIYDNSKN